MSLLVVVGHDCITSNVEHLPAGLAVGYTTGDGIAWTQAQWDAHPGALRICQDAGATDTTADYLDVESGAATPADCPGWAKAAHANWVANKRPGQRTPAIYVNGNNVTAVANALKAGGIESGVGIVLANWNLDQAEATADVLAGSGPYPVVGIQFSDPGPYDSDIFSVAWVNNVSGAAPTAAAAPKGLSQTVYDAAITADFGLQVEDAAGDVVSNSIVTTAFAHGVKLTGPGPYRWRVSVDPGGLWSAWTTFAA
jgi:hypothetical protein